MADSLTMHVFQRTYNLFKKIPTIRLSKPPRVFDIIPQIPIRADFADTITRIHIYLAVFLDIKPFFIDPKKLDNIFMLKLPQNFCLISDTFPHQARRDKVFLFHSSIWVVYLVIVFLLEESLFINNFYSVIPTVFYIFCPID